MSGLMFANKIPIVPERDPKTGLIPCTSCTQCCQYVAIEIDTPEDRKDFDNIRWYLYHPGIEVYIDHDDTWNVLFHSRCENLEADGKCGVYETRPIICRNFSVHTCEPNTGEPAEKVLLRNAADLEQWLRLTRTDVRLVRQDEARERRRQRRAEARARMATGGERQAGANGKGQAGANGKGRAPLEKDRGGRRATKGRKEASPTGSRPKGDAARNGGRGRPALPLRTPSRAR